MEDLEKVLKKVQQEDTKTKRKLNRRFIVVEGVYFNFGDIAPLDKIMELKRKYFYRIMMDDSYGIGVVGKTGRGTCEVHGVDVTLKLASYIFSQKKLTC
jgi:serine palmitoyltransferase